MPTASELIRTAHEDYGSIGEVTAAGFSGAILAFWVSSINFIQAIANFFLSPLGAFGDRLADVVNSFVGGGASIIEQGAVTTIQSIAPGATWAVGPLTFAFGVIAAAGGLFAMAWVLQQAPTSDLIPFSFTDVPGAGTDEEGENEG